jgi:perosamine synthetase
MNMEKTLLTDESLVGSQSGTNAIYEMEQRFNSHFDSKMQAIGLCNATMALMSVMLGLGLKPGDKILTTPFTWGGSIAGALFLQLKVVFADVDLQTLTLSPGSVSKILQEHNDIKLILDVDIFGNPSIADEIGMLAKRYNCFHLIDSASGFGSFYKGKPSGYFADAVVYSFSESKVLNAGEGSVLMIKNPELYEKIIFLTQHPYRAKRDMPDSPANQFALNFRIHPVAAMIINSEFEMTIHRIAKKRDIINDLLRKVESELNLKMKLHHAPDFQHAFSRLCLVMSKKNRRLISEFLKERYPEFRVGCLSILNLLPDDQALLNAGYDELIISNRIKLKNAYSLFRNAFEINISHLF